jgi:hypothetical protein
LLAVRVLSCGSVLIRTSSPRKTYIGELPRDVRQLLAGWMYEGWYCSAKHHKHPHHVCGPTGKYIEVTQYNKYLKRRLTFTRYFPPKWKAWNVPQSLDGLRTKTERIHDITGCWHDSEDNFFERVNYEIDLRRAQQEPFREFENIEEEMFELV